MKATTILLAMLSISFSALAQSPTPPELPAEMQPQLQPPLQPPVQAEPQTPTQPESQFREPAGSLAIHAQPQSQNGFTYVCGGVGLDESTSMKRMAKKYDLMSTFSTRNGSYLADINVNISSGDGKATLQTTCDGPILLVKFPHAGTYRIRAAVGDDTQTKTAQIPGLRSMQSMVFVWRAS
ncbi:putative exported protein [Collimonas arenae]|uniref:Putative exported protein n=1 Tax=Collimonas arenae TaxID=279058 RepID=A0A0A1FC07_9BURK|nr:hypothetical protein [Collimonas arenae]AIY42086.1 putative exported protein [Collimonas arenae]